MDTYRTKTGRRRGAIGRAPESLEDRRLMTYGAARFMAGPPIPIEGTSQKATLADFNLDGKLDVATSNGRPDGIAVALGDGDGTFQAARYFQAPSDKLVTGLEVGDFNDDGKPDLALTTYSFPSSTTVLDVLINTSVGGGLSFDRSSTATIGNYSQSPTVGDFNNDGALDVAVGHAGSFDGGVGVLLGDGSGSFQPMVETFVPGNVTQVATGDFNRDGKLDLAVIYYSRTVFDSVAGILLGDGDGSFQGVKKLGVEPTATGLSVADFNRDGIPDLAVTASVNILDGTGANQVTVLLGDGAGAFTKRASIPFASAATAVATADFNGNGRLDLAVVTPADHSLTVLYGDGRGGFVKLRPRQSVFPVDADAVRKSIAVGRVANRTLPDVVVANGSSGHINVLLNRSRFSKPLRRLR